MSSANENGVLTPEWRGPRASHEIRAIGLPDAAFEALKLIVHALARGQTITIIPHDKELTAQAAADLLHVSRPDVIKLLEAGELPFHRVGTHRRIRLEDVIAYRERRTGRARPRSTSSHGSPRSSPAGTAEPASPTKRIPMLARGRRRRPRLLRALPAAASGHPAASRTPVD